MNFLAHSYLSFGDPDLLIGQFLADKVKGKAYLCYPSRIQNGILLHRFIDSYTDGHPICLNLRALLRPYFGLLTPVAMDVFFDHALAKTWGKYSPMTLHQFAVNTYTLLESYDQLMHPATRYMFKKMKQSNWLEMYKGASGTSTLLVQMSERLPYGAPLKNAPLVLKDYKKEILKTFENFFPEIKRETFSKLDTFAHLQP